MDMSDIVQKVLAERSDLLGRLAKSDAEQTEPTSTPRQRRVVCAANRLGGDIICAPRHFDPTMRAQIRVHPAGVQAWAASEQGFVDQWGAFMGREEALEVARAAGQILRRCGGDETQLFSENLY